MVLRQGVMIYFLLPSCGVFILTTFVFGPSFPFTNGTTQISYFVSALKSFSTPPCLSAFTNSESHLEAFSSRQNSLQQVGETPLNKGEKESSVKSAFLIRNCLTILTEGSENRKHFKVGSTVEKRLIVIRMNCLKLLNSGLFQGFDIVSRRVHRKIADPHTYHAAVRQT